MPNVLGISDGMNHHDRTMHKTDQTVNQISFYSPLDHARP